ncbi:MAG TPA: hypothetical protein P5120_03510 [Spirochaetota bacterium]|nr:hypothetical protein [Spirochaetota bacterium]HPF05101.1 hypothetical protein [Spirochaetota bacterium]HPJ41506.1 hypothetical protein [Spirochaetota bacterium]HPR37713.1 hypothetical protein [Spirochaetota bacterium]HRX46562.1 hypothetical protein [Spirochaetota bacterium]
MALLTCKKNSHSILVSFEGDTTVRSIAKIKNGFIKLLREPVNLYRIDVATITDTDFTFIQLLISYHFKLKSINRELVLVNSSGETAFMKTAFICGIDVRSILSFEGGADGC